MLENLGDEGESRLENIGQLISSVKTYADQKGPEASLSGFLEEAALISDLDSYDQETDVVVLMTMHSAKGLEFDYTYIYWHGGRGVPQRAQPLLGRGHGGGAPPVLCGHHPCPQGIVPFLQPEPDDLRQTRRNRPSRFLEEIDAALLDEKASPMAAQRSFGFGSFGGASAGAPPRGSVTGWTPGAGGWNRSPSAGSAAPARTAGFGPTVGVAPQPRPATGKNLRSSPATRWSTRCLAGAWSSKPLPPPATPLWKFSLKRPASKRPWRITPPSRWWRAEKGSFVCFECP